MMATAWYFRGQHLKHIFAEGELQQDSVVKKSFTTAGDGNRIVADMAVAVLVVHAAPGSKIEALSLELLAAGKSLYTFNHPANAALIHAGARPIIPETNWKLNLTL